MRNALAAALLLAVSCATAPPPAPAPEAKPAELPYGMTVEEEARILALEDRRELDTALIDAWVKHENPLHRQRIALALGRIGPHNFGAGVDHLALLVADPDRRVRETVAFALGEIGNPKGIDALFTLANDSDAAIAAEAAEALAKLAPKDLWSRYEALTKEPYAEGVRARAVRYLFRFDNDTASAVAMANLGSASDAIRQEAAYALARRAYAPAREQLELVMNDRGVLTRAYATTALGRIGDWQSKPVIVQALGDAHPWVRTNAVIALARLAANDIAILHVDEIPRIIALLEDPDPGVRTSTIATLGYYAELNETARSRLLAVFRNGTQWDRELAAGAIARHFPPDSETFKALGEDLSAWSRVRVIESTAAKPHGAAIRAKYANAPEPMVRAAAVSNIPDEGADAEAELIRKLLTDPDVIVRANAIDRFAAMKSPDFAALRQMEERERNESLNDARLSAIGSLARLDFPEREAFLTSLLADRDPVVRRAASEAIAQHYKKQLPYAPLAIERPAEEYAEIVRWSRQPHTATIHMTRGVIDLVLLSQEAPMTAWNFASLAKRKYFDNTSFMRVVPNFVIQGGDPRNDMNGGPGYSIRDEINLQKYTRGAVGMALSGPDTGGSQYFITHSPQPHLDGGYTIFGRVYDGMNSVVDQVERGDRVLTITIDEKPAPAGGSSVPNVSLPLEIGPMTADRLLTRIPEYGIASTAYEPDATVLDMLKTAVREGDRIEVYMGTWCPDSVREVPKFLRIAGDLKSLGVEIPTKFVAVDRSKQKPADLIAGKEIQKIATFIYYRGAREIGRIEEKPASLLEDDLLAIASSER